MSQKKTSDKPKYRPGDRLLAFVTVTESRHCDSVFVITDSREAAQLKESDIHSVVLLRFNVGERVEFTDSDHSHRSATIKSLHLDADAPQAWIKVDSEWQLRTIGLDQLRRI